MKNSSLNMDRILLYSVHGMFVEIILVKIAKYVALETQYIGIWDPLWDTF